MANVSLRSYNRDIESLIDRNQLDEAIAHCRHILQTYSKHLETYRLLGKAYLESKRYDEAVDVFSRVLMSVPDDFVSHVGMSIIRDEQNKLDDAIWHMERAFEAQPSNAAIQGELQRLFGRRDGVEPSKIRMTRGALAHMYVQGELFPQAISEIKAVLVQDNERDDMKTLLARAYFHAGQKADASDVCSQLLERYPYSFDANRIMVELLQGSNNLEDREAYRTRVAELDPYAAYVQGSVFRSKDVADAAVGLERLEYHGQDVPVSADWSPPGISAGTSAAAEQPDWLKTAYSEEPAAPVESKPEIPDFLRAAGWEESTGAAEEPAPLGEAGEEPEMAPGEMPDWLRAMAPLESEPPAPVPSPEPQAAPEAPNWLDDLRSAPPAPAEEASVPDWLKNVEATEPEAAPSSLEPALEAELPDWLTPAGETPSQPVVPEGFQPLEPEGFPPLEPEIPAPAIPPEPAASLETLGTSAQEQDDAMAWLESLAAKHGAKAEELVTDPNARTDKPPEWVEQARALGEAAPAAPASEPEPPVAEEFDLRAFERTEQQEPAQFLEPEAPTEPAAEGKEPEPLEPSLDETGIWLRGLEEKESGEPGEPSKSFDFFAPEAESPKVEEPPAAVEPWTPEVGLPKEEEAQLPPAEETPAPETATPQSIDLPDWLRGLDQTDEVPGLSTINTDELPSWLQGEAEPPVEAEPTAPSDWRPVEAIPEQDLTPEELVTVPEPAQEYLEEARQLREQSQEVEPEPQREIEAEPELEREIELAPEPESEPEPPPAAPPVRPVEQPAPVRRPPVRPPAERSERRPPAPAASTEADPILRQAQNEINRGNIPAALEQYTRLIKRGKFLEEIIRDLRDALYRYPVEVTIWQTLGDAYMRENRLQEALDSYTKAEELLR